MNIQEIIVKKFPLIIFSDTHCGFANINKLKELYPESQLLCLGDITSLWSKAESFNETAIQYFIKNKIPCLRGNHEEHIEACQRGGKQYLFRALSFGEYAISKESEEFIKNLPIGFKIECPDGRKLFAFHNRPNDLWAFLNDSPIKSVHHFCQIYPVTSSIQDVIIGHHHENFTKGFGVHSLFGVGRLTKDGHYILINENGLHFKQI